MKDALHIVDEIRQIPDKKKIDLIIDISGGDPMAGEVIVNALKNHEGDINVYVPYRAQNIGFLVTLAGDNIYFGKNSFVTIPCVPEVNSYALGRICNIVKDRFDTPIYDISDIGDVSENNKKEIEFVPRFFSDIIATIFVSNIDGDLKNIYSGVPDDIYDLFKIRHALDLQ